VSSSQSTHLTLIQYFQRQKTLSYHTLDIIIAVDDYSIDLWFEINIPIIKIETRLTLECDML
jgi:hypothetical protein